MTTRLQRWYAFAVFLLRDFFRGASSDGLFEWKTRTVLTISQASLVAAAMLMVSAGWDTLAFMRSTGGFVGCGVVVGMLFYWANRRAEQRLLPRFEQDFRRLGRSQRIVGTIGIIVLLALTVSAAIEAAAAGHRKLTSAVPIKLNSGSNLGRLPSVAQYADWLKEAPLAAGIFLAQPQVRARVGARRWVSDQYRGLNRAETLRWRGSLRRL